MGMRVNHNLRYFLNLLVLLLSLIHIFKNLLLERKHTVDPMDSLTDREMDVLRLIATGLSNKQIAGQLFISEETVKLHIRNLLRKLNVHSRVAATGLFFERNGR